MNLHVIFNASRKWFPLCKHVFSITKKKITLETFNSPIHIIEYWRITINVELQKKTHSHKIKVPQSVRATYIAYRTIFIFVSIFNFILLIDLLSVKNILVKLH